MDRQYLTNTSDNATYADDWELVTWNFIAATDGSTLLYFEGGNVGSDDIAITEVPEPMTMALLGLGGLFLRRKKR